MKLRKVFKPPIIEEWTALLREKGVKGFLREKGWKFFAAVIVFYFVRDSLLYIVIPFLVAQGFICGK